jgi:hypothetical protein
VKSDVVSERQAVIGSSACLFADTKAREDPTEQIIRTELPGDSPQRLLRHSQIFCEQLSCAQAYQLLLAMHKEISRLPQRIQMAAPRAEQTLGGLLITHAAFQVLA